MSKKERSSTTIAEDTLDEPHAGEPGDGGGYVVAIEHEFDVTAPHQLRLPTESEGDFDERTNPELRFDAAAAAADIDAAEPALAGADTTTVMTNCLPEAESGYVGMLESEVQELSALINERDARLRAAHDEVERSRARVERDAERWLAERTRGVILGFIEVLDDLDRALAAARQDSASNSTVTEGIELVRRRFLGKLAEHGVEHQPSMGARFDPAVHEAVSVVAVTDATLDGMVVGVVREGYCIHGHILRPAGVTVGKGG